MRRAFYRDALAAAWMSKHHGITFDNGDRFKSACEMMGETMKGSKCYFYIALESMHLFEPMVGDLILIGSPDIDKMEAQEVFLYADKLRVTSDGTYIVSKKNKVIMRDGIAFMQPEYERCLTLSL